MLRLAWRGVRHNPGRYIATLVAIVTGVAFFSATGFVSDRVIDTLEGDVDRQFGTVDVAVVVDDTGDSDNADDFSDQLRISGADAAAILGSEGVEAGAGIVTGAIGFLGDDGRPFAENSTGRLWIEDEELNPLTLEEGAAPVAAGELVVDQATASDHDLDVGDDVTVLTLAGQFPGVVVGITSFGSSDSIDTGGTVSLPEVTTFEWLTAGQEEYEALYLRTSGGTDSLTEDLESLAPTGFMVQSGEEFRADLRSEIGGVGRFLKFGLQAFAILAMLVGGFVIYNTFSVIVSQRLRELAIMAAIGATPKQIKRSLRYEGFVIGLLGSALGLIAGFGLAYLLGFVLSAAGVDLPGSGIQIGTSNVVGAMLLGTVITVLSVMIPARRAARTEPIEALRVAAVESTAFSRGRMITAIVLLALGLGGLLLGGGAAVVGLGALLLFVGVIVAGPAIAVGGSRVLRPIMDRFGLEGRLADDNVARNPRRTATTANALLIGVFLVTLVAVAGTSLKDFVVGEIKKLESADYLIVSTGGTIDDEFVSGLETIDHVTVVTPFRRESVTIAGEAGLLFTGDIVALQEIADLETSEGSFDDVGPDTIAVIDRGDAGPAIGETVAVADAAGDTVELDVVALIEPSIDTATSGSYVTDETFDSLVGDTAPTVAFVDVDSGAETETKEDIEDQAALRPDIEVTEGNALGRLIGSVFDFMINAVIGLLLMSVVVALIGIVNTLSLSILERRRELGLLRAVGMTDKRVRQMVRLESMLISALGTISGLLLGLLTAWGLIFSIDRLTEAGIGYSFPGVILLLVLVFGVVLGLLASLIPAQRSTRLDVLDAIEPT